jgi:hypothetical protein
MVLIILFDSLPVVFWNSGTSK